MELTTGNVNGDKFLEFVQGTLIPEMELIDGTKRKSIVVLDNCSIHHARSVKDTLQDAGILVIYLPPYSPDLNPIRKLLVTLNTTLRIMMTCYKQLHNQHQLYKLHLI